MSTRCQIGFYERKYEDFLEPYTILYRHSDGYPEGVLPDLVPFLKLFQKRRGLFDVEYAAAWTMHHLIDLHVGRHKEYAEMCKKQDGVEHDWLPLDGKDCIGYGISDGFHADIEYYYAIEGATLKVYKVKMNFDRPFNTDDFTLLDTIDLGDENEWKFESKKYNSEG
jgi:hypothetical protein